MRSILKLIFGNRTPDVLRFAVNGKFKVKIDRHHSFLMITNPTSPVANQLFWGGVFGYEFYVFRIFKCLIQECEVFLDVGANTGYYSLVAASLNKKLKIFAFEPLPAAYKYLCKNISLNNFLIQTFPCALSDKKGKAMFYSHKNPKFPDVEDHLCGDSTLNPDIKLQNRFSFEVFTETLDDLYYNHIYPLKIDFLKLDTEGSEDLILDGSKKTITECRPILMIEVLANTIENKIQLFIESFNYKILEVESGKPEWVEKIEVTSWKKDYFLIPVEKKEFIMTLLGCKI